MTQFHKKLQKELDLSVFMLGLMMRGQMRCRYMIGQRVWVKCNKLGKRSKDYSFRFFLMFLCLWRQGCFFPLGIGRAFLTGSFYDLFGGRKTKGKITVTSAFTVFLNSFTLRYSIFQGAIFWGWCVLNPVIHSPVWNSPRKFYSIETELVDCPKHNPINQSLSSRYLYGNKRKNKG